MLGARRSGALGADGLGLPGLPQPTGHGMLSRCSPASARRCVPRSGRAASRFRCGKQSPNAAAKSAEAERRALRTGSTARPGALDFRCRVAVSGPLPCLAGLGDVPGLQGGSPAKTGKPAKPRSELCREDAEPPRSTPSASDPSPSRRGSKGSRPVREDGRSRGLVARRAGEPIWLSGCRRTSGSARFALRKIGGTARRRRRSA